MRIKFIKSAEKKKLIKQLNEQYGISSLPYLLLKTGKDKIRGYSGSLSKDEILKLNKELRIELLGLYLMEKEWDGIRLSFDFVNIIKPKRSMVEVDDRQAERWLKGQDIAVKKDLKGFVVLKNKENLLGCGKASGGRVTNFVPKDRRIKS